METFIGWRPYRTENKLETHEKICKDHDFCDVKMPDKDNIF